MWVRERTSAASSALRCSDLGVSSYDLPACSQSITKAPRLLPPRSQVRAK